MKASLIPEDRAFQKAIRAKPDARVIRLVYADWLDERSDPRGELIRIEEEARSVPIHSDVYWQLKPRRRELLKVIEKPWLKQMGYGGTDYQPVFADIPTGWKERWRLLREFVERWYQIPMDDVGGPLKPFPPGSGLAADIGHLDVDEAMNDPKVFKRVPPSVHEWTFFIRDLLLRQPDIESCTGNTHRLGEFEKLLYFMQLQGGRQMFFVRPEDKRVPDPPVWWDSTINLQLGIPASERGPDHSRLVVPHVTSLALHYLLAHLGNDLGEGEFYKEKMTKKFARRLENYFPARSHFDDIQVFDRPNVIAFWTPQSAMCNGEAPCFRLFGRTRNAWEEAFDQLFSEEE